MNEMLIVPMVHRNGTSREELLRQRCDVASSLRGVLETLAQMAPNGRDYYLEYGRMKQAVIQHQNRVALIRSLLSEIESEADVIADGEVTHG